MNCTTSLNQQPYWTSFRLVSLLKLDKCPLCVTLVQEFILEWATCVEARMRQGNEGQFISQVCSTCTYIVYNCSILCALCIRKSSSIYSPCEASVCAYCFAASQVPFTRAVHVYHLMPTSMLVSGTGYNACPHFGPSQFLQRVSSA